MSTYKQTDKDTCIMLAQLLANTNNHYNTINKVEVDKLDLHNPDDIHLLIILLVIGIMILSALVIMINII